MSNYFGVNNNIVEFALYDENNATIIRDYQDEPYFDQLEVGIYTINVRDKNGCGEDNIAAPILNFPIFFTPNNDGIKDTWNVEGISSTFFVESSLIYIFDRYGKPLAKLSVDGSWDGTYNGKLVSSSDYWYKVELIDKYEKVYRRKGNFSLLRR